MLDLSSKQSFRAKPSYRDGFLYKQELVETWLPVSEIYPFKYGDDVLGMIAGAGGLFTTFVFRKALKIRPYARMTCYFPVVGVAALSTYLISAGVISAEIVMSKKCPLCIWTKANLGQFATGVVYPLIGAPVVCFYMADRLLTYPVPPLVRAPREAFTLFYKIVSKNSRPFLIIGAVNIIACSIVTYLKQDAFQTVEYKTLMRRQTHQK